MKKVFIIFTRDINQWSNDLVRESVVNVTKKKFGFGLNDNISFFTGRSFNWIRYRNDFIKLEKKVLNLPLNHKLFSKEANDRFLEIAKNIRKLIKIKNINDSYEFIINLKNLFIEMYPIYILSVFVPGLWHNNFFKKHGKKGKIIVDRLMKSRKYGEGLVKEIDLFMRSWLGNKFLKLGYPKKYIRLMRVKEIENFIKDGILPTKLNLSNRWKGYVVLNNKLYLIRDIVKFFKKRNINIENLFKDKTNLVLIQGTIAYKGKKMIGIIKTVFNQEEVKFFKKGRILLTPMTSPEFLPAMRRAKAIITDEGGITCHAAIVARELKKPCIIGTKFATKVFKDGDRVEIDANKGIIKKISN